MIKPVLQHNAFLTDVHGAVSQRNTLHLWWLGQSGYLVQWNGAHLLLDPYLSDSLTKKYAHTTKPHVRMTELVIAPERLDFIDVVTSSHNHTDHLDGETLTPLLRANPDISMIVSEANRAFAADRLHVDPSTLTGITLDLPVTCGPFTFHVIPAAHEELEQDDNGHHRFIGLIVEVGPWTLYHSGDTMRFAGMVETLRRWPIDVAMLPINGRDPARGVAGNLSGSEAAALASEIGARIVIPCHYEMFEFNTISPTEFMQAAQRLAQPYCILRAGERWSSSKSSTI